MGREIGQSVHQQSTQKLLYSLEKLFSLKKSSLSRSDKPQRNSEYDENTREAIDTANNNTKEMKTDDEDMNLLLPSDDGMKDNLCESNASSSDGGIMAEGETSSSSSEESEMSGDEADAPPCDLSLMERLLRTHPVWFLPSIQRSGAVHLLQGKEEGVSWKI